jgi:hypothetical protein
LPTISLILPFTRCILPSALSCVLDFMVFLPLNFGLTEV